MTHLLPSLGDWIALAVWVTFGAFAIAGLRWRPHDDSPIEFRCPECTWRRGTSTIAQAIAVGAAHLDAEHPSRERV